MCFALHGFDEFEEAHALDEAVGNIAEATVIGAVALFPIDVSGVFGAGAVRVNVAVVVDGTPAAAARSRLRLDQLRLRVSFAAAVKGAARSRKE